MPLLVIIVYKIVIIFYQMVNVSIALLGYSLKNGTCQSTCSNQDYTLRKCKDLATFCVDEWALPPLCTSCRPGYVKSSTINKCIKCGNKCKTCSENDLNTCLSCDDTHLADNPVCTCDALSLYESNYHKNCF